MEPFIKPTHITDYLERNADRYGRKTAVVFEGREQSWQELWAKVQAGAASIADRLAGEEQQVVAIFLPNSIEFIEAYLAIIHSGHMALPLDPAYKGLELDAILDQVYPELLVTDQEYVQKLSPEHQRQAVFAADLSVKATPGGFIRQEPGKQVASLTFTSGTTGKPKTVPYTHANHIWNIEVCSRAWDWTHADSLLVNVPLGHFNGVVMALSGALYHANTIYLHRWFDEKDTLEALASGKVSMYNQSASAYVKLTAMPRSDFDLSKVRLCTSGAAALPPAVWQEFKDRYGIEIVETYGSSETGRIAGNRLDERVLGSPGRPFPGVEVRLNKDGELEVKSGGVFPGYYKNPEATAGARTPDGYWRTGDMAEIKDGYIHLKGRIQERIRRFGYTISPRDVEWALHKHPKIKDVLVMGRQAEGRPDDELIYFIVTELSDEEINAYCKANLLFAWRPNRIIHLDDLPRTRSGKARIGKLREMLVK